ncbi:hypothetical protein PAXRUDRAFT_823959 [Paxillus rubicundulus Ve08.2h10]|uniref:Uncharacterized protein n=1 Tax=Paxillus rubicundulus Ve08.2h10 TaxID=930991 RepID=A0A0D0E2S9_9AGAM|nr:hypothetical protein PAXRUDRAFT_823959 [Paxillus rubicundulus Ve08.2h10]
MDEGRSKSESRRGIQGVHRPIAGVARQATASSVDYWMTLPERGVGCTPSVFAWQECYILSIEKYSRTKLHFFEFSKPLELCQSCSGSHVATPRQTKKYGI